VFFYLFLLFTGIPLIELALLIEVGRYIGTLHTILIVVGTGLVGSILVRLEGLHVLLSMRERMARGELPGDELIEGVLILIAGALLITPGLLTDALGGLFVFPPTRRAARELIKRYLRRKVKDSFMEIRIGPPTGPM